MIADTIFGSLEDAHEPAPDGQGQPDQQTQEPSQAPKLETPQAQAPDTGQPEDSVDDGSQQGQPEVSGQFKSLEDLQRSYQELRSAYNRRDQEISQLRQQNQQLLAYLQQLMYSGYQQGQPQQQAPAQSQQQQVDPEQWFEELQRKGPAAVQEIVNREVQRQAQELLVGLQQMLIPLYQQYQVSSMRENFNSQANQLVAKYPDAPKYAGEMTKLVQEQPHLVQLAMLPNGMEMLYQAAKLRVLESQNKEQQNQVQKKAAQMPSTGASRPGPQPTVEDIIRQQVFGASGSTKGIFD